MVWGKENQMGRPGKPAGIIFQSQCFAAIHRGLPKDRKKD